jgi:uncharacterized protein YhdP
VLIWVIVLAGLLMAGRMALPSILRSQINARLNRVSGYTGRVGEMHVALWRGAYALREVRILKKRAAATHPFFSARNIDVSLAWRELVHGKIVTDIIIEDARINFVKTASPETNQLKVDRAWQDVVKHIFPIDITHLEIRNGRIHYLDRTASPVVDVYVENLQCVASGLRNRPSGKGFPAHLQLSGESIGGGKLSVWADADPLASKLHCEVHGQIEEVALPALNPFLKAYGNVEIRAGTFKLYAEMAARDGRFEGYVKPFFTHVKFTDITQPGKPFTQRIWQAVASALVTLLKNKPQDELATRIPFAGESGATAVDTWKTITSMLHNGFIHALPAKLELDVKSDAVKTGKPGTP